VTTWLATIVVNILCFEALPNRNESSSTSASPVMMRGFVSCRIVTCRDVDEVQSSDLGGLSLQPLNDAKTMDEIQEEAAVTNMAPAHFRQSIQFGIIFVSDGLPFEYGTEVRHRCISVAFGIVPLCLPQLHVPVTRLAIVTDSHLTCKQWRS